MVGQINHHLYRKRGFYYFYRRVPKALLSHYPKPRIVVALKTRQFRDALRQSQIISKRLDDQWLHMQLDAMGLDNVQAKLFQPVKPSAPLMSEATSFYLRLKGDGKDKVFIRAAQRNAASVIEVLGDRPINDYVSSEAGRLRDVLLDRGLAVTSIKRMFGSVKAIINLAKAEHGIEGRNPFASIYMPDETPEERKPISLDAIRRIQNECKQVDDENRWLLALTGGCLPLLVTLGCVYQRLQDCIKMTSFLMLTCLISKSFRTHGEGLRPKTVRGIYLWLGHLCGQLSASNSMIVAMPSHAIAMARYAMPTQLVLH